MGAVVTVTIGTSNYDVYAWATDAVADATTFFNGLLGTGAAAWSAAATNDKKRALVMAADWLDRATGPLLSGSKTSSTQPREWPRDGASCNGEAVADGTTPDLIATAQFWLAGQLLLDPSLASGTGTGSNVKQAKAGSASVTFFQPTIGGTTDTRLPITAMDYVKCFFSGAGTAAGVGLASGVDGESAFGTCDFKRSEGFS